MRVRSRGLRWALVAAALATALFGVATLGGVTTAHAASPAAFSVPTPAADAVLVKKVTWLSVKADDSAPIISATMLVNGLPVPVTLEYPTGHFVWDDEAESNVWVNDDPTLVRVVFYNCQNRILPGVNTVAATVTSSNGTSSYSWAFTYGSASTVGVVSPADGTTLASAPSSVTAAMVSASTSFTSAMRIDGVTVPLVYSPSTKTFTHSPAAAISPGAHTVAFSAKDAAGATVSKTWSFTVRPPMSTGNECVSCHTTYPTLHPTSVCSSCHTHGYTVTGGSHGNAVPTAEGCTGDGTQQASACHRLDHASDSTFGVWGSGPFTCTTCHSVNYPAVSRHTDASLTASHVSTTTGCSPCHAESLIAEHAKYPSAVPIKFQCDLCHGASAAQPVKDAVASGTTACGACHTFGGTGHEALHALDRTDLCAQCHAGEDLTAVHSSKPCEACHKSVEPAVVAAITGHQRNCSACHSNNHASYAASGHDHFTSYESAPSLRALWFWPSKTPAASGTCVNCHTGDGSATYAQDNALCITCHDDSGKSLVGYGYPGVNAFALSSHGSAPAVVRRTRTAADYAEGTFTNTSASAGDNRIQLLGGSNANLALGKGAVLQSPTTSAYGTPAGDYTDGNAGTGGFFRGWIEIKGMGFPNGTGYVYAMVDLGQECNVRGVRVSTGGYMGAAAEVLGGSAAYSFPTTGTLGVANGSLAANFAPQKSRYVYINVSKRMYYYDPIDISSIGLNEIAVYGDAMSGTWTSPVIDISDSRPVTSASLNWKADGPKAGAPYDSDWDDIIDTFPRDATATVDAQVSFDGGSTWGGWQRLTQAPGAQPAPLPMLPAGTDISNARIRYRANLDRCDATTGLGPVIGDFALSIGRAAANAATTYPGTAEGAGECTNCHDPHGTADSVGVRAAGNQLCFGCHDAAGITPRATYRYKGKAEYAASEHGTQACAGCHKVHGQPDTLGLIASLLGQDPRSTCMSCHNGASNSANGTDIGARFSASANPLAHHGVQPAEQDSGRTKVDCADCHQPHSVTAATPLSDPVTGASYTSKVSDPSDQVIARTIADTFMLSAAPTANRGGLTYARVHGLLDSGNEGRALLKFNDYDLPAAARIKKATLKVMTINSSYRRGTIKAFPVTSDWMQGTDSNAAEAVATSIGVSWNNSYVPATATWTTPGGAFSREASGVGTVDSAARYQQIDVTDVVKWQKVNGNHGIVLVGGSLNADMMFNTADKNYSESAVIVFELDTATPKADDVAFCGGCHATATPPTGVKVGSTRSITSWAANDVHGGKTGEGMYATGGYDAGGGLLAPYYYGYPTMTCATCHDPHGSSNAFHLREKVNGVTTATNIAADGTGAVNFCKACHSSPHHTVLGNWQNCFGCHHHGSGF